MLSPQHLATFSAIVSAGSISKAAMRLGCGKSVVSRQLAKLEADLGARLIQRTTRRLTLTEVGEAVLLEAQQIDRSLANVEQISGQFQQEVRGRLRVACPRPLGQRHLVPLLTEFTQRYPLVDITLLVEDRLSDLVAEQIDVAVRISHLEDSTLVARQLALTTRVLVASPAYLARAGTPTRPADLAQHNCLLYVQGHTVRDEWTFRQGGTTVVVHANGFEVESLLPGGDRVKFSGTSMATPYAALRLRSAWRRAAGPNRSSRGCPSWPASGRRRGSAASAAIRTAGACV